MSTGVVTVACVVTGVATGLVLPGLVARVSPASSTPRVRRAIQVATPVVFGLIGWRFGADVAVPAYCLLAAALIALTAIDATTHRLPREITYPATVAGAALLTVAALVDGEPARIALAALGAAVALAGMWIVRLASGGDLGDGDVRLAPLLGMYLGYTSLSAVAVGLFVGFALAAVAGVVLGGRRGDRRTTIPFGPFLAVGALATILIAGPAPLNSIA